MLFPGHRERCTHMVRVNRMENIWNYSRDNMYPVASRQIVVSPLPKHKKLRSRYSIETQSDINTYIRTGARIRPMQRYDVLQVDIKLL